MSRRRGFNGGPAPLGEPNHFPADDCFSKLHGGIWNTPVQGVTLAGAGAQTLRPRRHQRNHFLLGRHSLVKKVPTGPVVNSEPQIESIFPPHRVTLEQGEGLLNGWFLRASVVFQRENSEF